MHEPTAPLRDRQGGAVRASWTDTRQAFRTDVSASLRPTPFVLGAIVGLLLAYLAPFGSERADIYRRMIYWPGVIVGGTLVGIVVSAAVGAVFDGARRRPIATTFLTAAVMTMPAALLVWAVTQAVFGAQLLSFPGLLPPVFLLSLAMTGLNQLAERRARPSEPASVAARPTEVRFLERLPPRLRGAELHAVQAEDHYLRLHTSAGSDLILLRLADAIAELEGLDGAQTHRSWWVARAAVRDVRRGDGRAVLVLPGGVEAPVSRSFAPALRDRGWY